MSDFTELVFILDRSGSMSGLESDTIEGFNSMLAKQKDGGHRYSFPPCCSTMKARSFTTDVISVKSLFLPKRITNPLA